MFKTPKYTLIFAATILRENKTAKYNLVPLHWIREAMK